MARIAARSCPAHPRAEPSVRACPGVGGAVVPAPLPAERLDYRRIVRLPQPMAEHGVYEERLAKGNEPGVLSYAPVSRGRREKRRPRRPDPGVESKVRIMSTDAAPAELGQASRTCTARGTARRRSRRQQLGTSVPNALERQRVTNRHRDQGQDARRRGGHPRGDGRGSQSLFEAGLSRAEAVYAQTFEDEKGALELGDHLGSDWNSFIGTPRQGA